jgi:hypothetical protein
LACKVGETAGKRIRFAGKDKDLAGKIFSLKKVIEKVSPERRSSLNFKENDVRPGHLLAFQGLRDAANWLGR